MAELRAQTVHPAGNWPKETASDAISLTYDERHRRRFHFTAEGGIDFLLDLARAVVLTEGDGLELSDGRMIIVRAAPENLTKVTAHSAGQLVQLAWHIGNRHLPAQLTGDAIYIRQDHVITAMLEGLGAHVAHVKAPFTPQSGAYSGGHGHGSGHSHSHDHDG